MNVFGEQLWEIYCFCLYLIVHDFRCDLVLYN